MIEIEQKDPELTKHKGVMAGGFLTMILCSLALIAWGVAKFVMHWMGM